MDELLAILFSLPTLPWTCLVVASIVYWLTVILGALDIEVLGGAEGKAVGKLGHGHELGHGHAHDGHAHDGHAELGDAAAGKGVLASLLSALRLRSVPVTITLSLLGLFGWIVSYVLAKNVTLPLPTLASDAIVLAVSSLVSLLATSAAVRPLAPLFATRQGTKHDDLVGKVVRITTGRVDGRFGEGHLEDGGAGLSLQVRCADPDVLRRDDEALILGWDAASESFEVEPMSRIAHKTGRSTKGSGNTT